MSEQTSPLHHDASSAAPAREPARALPQLRFDAESLAWTRSATLWALIAIVVIGGFLRLSENNWDTNGLHSTHQHPDERFLTTITTDTKAPSGIANYFDTDTSKLNPYNIDRGGGQRQGTFVYGTLPLFLNKFVAANASILTVGVLDDFDDTSASPPGGYDRVHLPGRFMAGLFDIGTILLLFLLGRRLASSAVGVMAAGLYAFAPFPIQNAHFFIVDPYVSFFATLTVFFGVRSAQDGGWRNFVAAGASAGLATACKVTAVSLLPVVVLAIGIRAWPGIHPYVAQLWTGGDDAPYRARRNGQRLDESIITLIFGSLVALLAAFIAFRVAMPYAFRTPDVMDFFTIVRGHLGPVPILYPDIMNPQWLHDQVDQERLLSGNAAFPPNVQWIGRSKWLWPMQQMVSWGMGPALGITAWLGLIFAAIYTLKKKQGAWLVPLAWVIGYFGFMGAQYSLYMRYFLPLYAPLTLFAAFLLYHTWRWASSDGLASLSILGRRLSPLQPLATYGVRIGVAAVFVMTALAGIAFYNIYREPLTRIEASQWIHANVPEGSYIGNEHWDDVVPFGVPGTESRTYGELTFNNFEADSPQHVQELLDNIENVDYITQSSARISGTVTRVPAVWPITTRYYEALESGELGFEKVAEFSTHPSIFGMSFDDTGAEESFSVYDHPTVRVYKKTDDYSRERAIEVLGADAFLPGANVLPGNAGQNALLFRPDVAETQREGGTWTDIFDADGIVNDHPLIFWLIAMELAAFSLVPLAIVLFRGLPDRGFLLTKPLGILVLSYFAYAPAAFLGIDFTRAEIAAGLGVMLACGIAGGIIWRDEIRAWVSANWRLIVFCQAFYLLFFAGAWLLRMQNPDLWHPARGGEKPMDLAYFIGVTRTTDLTQGPIDPWSSGGYLNYYWYGQFISATITKLTGIVPEVAYNLLVPMYFALAAAATFSITYNLAEATRRLTRRASDGLPIRSWTPFAAALLGVFLVTLAGNLKAVGVFESQLSRISPWHTDVPLVGGVVAIVGGFKEIIFGDESWRTFVYGYDWWDPSRAIDVQNPQMETAPITEFPFWTFLFADLHAHLMAIPFALAAVGVALAVVLNFTRLNAGATIRSREVASWAMVAIIGLIVGALRWVNSWDYPVFLLLGAAALIVAERAKEGRFNVRALTMGGVKAAVMGVLSFAFFATIAKNYNQSYSSVNQSNQTTELADFFSHFGILLFLVGGFVIFGLIRSLTRDTFVRSIFFGSAKRRRPIDVAPIVAALVVAGAAIVWAGTTQRWGVTALSFVAIVAVLIAAWRLLTNPSPATPLMLFVYAMIALGFGLTGGVEVITLDGDIQRMNTVFKFYLHVWLLWGIAGAYAVWYILAVARPQDGFLRRLSATNQSLVQVPRYAFVAFAGILIALALIYPYFGTRSRVHDRFDPAQGAGINGMEYMDAAVYQDFDERSGRGGEHILKYERDGIEWLRQNVDGTPTIIEGITGIYHYGSRVSIYTGLPAVQGWDWHQAQQRAKFHTLVEQRKNDVNQFYVTEDVGLAREMIDKYDVEYVIVGSVERNYYPDEGINKFNGGLDGALELAYSNPGMQIWHVIPEGELPDTTSATNAP